MSVLGRLERAFEAVVEGSIARAFRLRVQPAEIGRQLERAMLEGRVTSVGVILAPNLYDVRLHPEDAAAYLEWSDALSREMESWLAELAYSRGIATVGAIRVRLTEDEGVRRRSVSATARFDADLPAGESRPPRTPRAIHLLPRNASGAAAFSVTRRVRIGRDEGNDLVVADPRVSRRHALIEPDGLGWRVVDLESTNGTWVNGARVEVSALRPGDDIAFGNARFTVIDE